MRPHNGTCSFCGSGVKQDFVTCTGCGATWTPTLGLIGHVLMLAVLPCGVAAALFMGFQTRSPEMGIASMLVAGLAMMCLALSSPFRTWLWVRR